jgi:hypothetical protein
VAGHIFQARPVWIYTQSNITNTMYIDVYPPSTILTAAILYIH